MAVSGIVNLYKEPGMTSFSAVAAVRRILGEKKAGHAGTLDPAAEGVLPVCVGRGTRVVPFLSDAKKEYRASMLLGVETDSQDTTGTVLRENPILCDARLVRETLLSMKGPLLQVPPMYSAKKINGQRLYELARQGLEVERKPVPVEIHELEVEEINLPFVTFRVVCSKGTYVRTLCHDVGQLLGCGAAMDHLWRLAAGDFRAEDAVTLDVFSTRVQAGDLDGVLMPVDTFFSPLPALIAPEPITKRLENGGVPESSLASDLADATRFRLYLADGRFMGICRKTDGKILLEQYFLE